MQLLVTIRLLTSETISAYADETDPFLKLLGLLKKKCHNLSGNSPDSPGKLTRKINHAGLESMASVSAVSHKQKMNKLNPKQKEIKIRAEIKATENKQTVQK